jgi:hypothetical protein
MGAIHGKNQENDPNFQFWDIQSLTASTPLLTSLKQAEHFFNHAFDHNNFPMPNVVSYSNFKSLINFNLNVFLRSQKSSTHFQMWETLREEIRKPLKNSQTNF